jgi:FixJ family two-component response regulator
VADFESAMGQMMAQLRARHITIPAILVASHPNENIRSRATAAGVPIVGKPFLGSRLSDAIRMAFGGHTSPSSWGFCQAQGEPGSDAEYAAASVVSRRL